MKIIKIGIIIILLGLLWIFKPIILLYMEQDKESIHNATYVEYAISKDDFEIEQQILKDDFEYESSYEKKLYKHKSSKTKDIYMSAYTKKRNRHKKSITKKRYKSTFRCDGRQYCSQMHSYEEAKYFNGNCPNTKMDGDNDGIPCERQFGRYD